MRPTPYITSGVDGLTLNAPTVLPATVVLKNAFDPDFEATLYYSGVLPYLSMKGSSSQSTCFARAFGAGAHDFCMLVPQLET